MTLPSAEQLRARFEAVEPLTVGLEEEVFLLHPETLDLVPAAREVVDRAGGDPRIKLEMPAAQVELVTQPHATVGDAIAELSEARAAVLRATEGLARPAAAAVHPFADPEGELNPGERYDGIADEYASIARRQLVCALQVHVAVGGADRTLAVYNALRGLLPEIAALAAAAPFHAGTDTGLASIRPVISANLPRQNVPPPIASWEEFAGNLRWGAASGSVPEPGRWWWELRPHALHGTLELRVPDVQPTLRGAEAVATFAHGIVRWLSARHDAGEALPAPSTWRIQENRWSALRHGVEGHMADLGTGERRPTRDRLRELIAITGASVAGPLVERNATMQLREVGLQRAALWLADQFRG